MLLVFQTFEDEMVQSFDILQYQNSKMNVVEKKDTYRGQTCLDQVILPILLEVYRVIGVGKLVLVVI